MFSLVARIFVLILLLALIVVAVLNCHREKTHRVQLQADSTGLESRLVTANGTINQLQNQANEALGFASRYKAQRDSAITGSDAVVGKLSYSQKVVAYLKALVANKTLQPPLPNAPPDLTTDEVLTAGLKTANREEIERTKSDSLMQSVAARDAKILALRQDKITLKNGLIDAKATALQHTKGGFLFIGAKRRSENKALVKQLDSTLHESELEQEVNQ